MMMDMSGSVMSGSIIHSFSQCWCTVVWPFFVYDPLRNALSLGMIEQLAQHLQQDPEGKLRAIVINANHGGKVFSSGHDLKEMVSANTFFFLRLALTIVLSLLITHLEVVVHCTNWVCRQPIVHIKIQRSSSAYSTKKDRIVVVNWIDSQQCVSRLCTSYSFITTVHLLNVNVVVCHTWIWSQ